MKFLIEKIIRLRNPAFRFDAHVTTGVLLDFLYTYTIRWLRGLSMLLRFRKPKGAMLGAGVRFFNLGKIQWGKFLKLDDHVYVSGLGHGGVRFGDHVGIGAHSRVVVSTSLNNLGHSIVIGHNVGIGEFAYLGGAGGLDIGADTIIGQYFSCHPENHICNDPGIAIRHQGVTRKGIIIGSNCWIGSKVTILDGVRLGNGCVVAAGAVITRSFPDNSVVGGVPAKLIRHRSNSNQPIQNHAA